MKRGRRRLLAGLLCMILSVATAMPEGSAVLAGQLGQDGQMPAADDRTEVPETGPDMENGMPEIPGESSAEEGERTDTESTAPEETQGSTESTAPEETQGSTESTVPEETQGSTESAVPEEMKDGTESRLPEEMQDDTESFLGEVEAETRETEEHANTLIPFEIDGTDIYAGFGEASFYGASKVDVTASRYDPRIEAPEEMTAVGNQNPWGTCWAFATMAVLENSMIRQGFSDRSIDLSERHLAYFSRNTGWDRLGNAGGDKITSSPDNTYLMSGGNAYMSAIRLMNWQGAAAEADYPYSGVETEMERIDASYAQDAAVLAHDFYFIPTAKAGREEKIDAVKKLIAGYGCVQWSYFDASRYFNDDTDAYYNPNNSSTNHAITVVGWDDDFPAGHFGNAKYGQAYKPDGNGAWIVKNSWGDGFGENGYFYISYEDQSLGSGNPASVAVAAAADTYDNNYFYGNTTYFSALRFGGAVRVAQVYQVKNDGESLTAVSVMLNSDQVDYQIQIYKNPRLEDGVVKDPESGEPVFETPLTGSTGYAGLYTIDLPEPVDFAKDDYMAVVIGIPANKSINIDGTGADRAVGSPFQVLYENETHTGQSFWFNGAGWIDTADPERSSSLYNFRINALTVNINDSEPLTEPVITPAPDPDTNEGILEEGQFITIKSKGGAAVYYTLDGTTPTKNSARYMRPVEVTEDVTVKAIAVRGGESSPVAVVSYKYYNKKPVLSETRLRLAQNRSHKLKVLRLPTLPEGTTAEVFFETSDETVAAVTKEGMVTGTGAGNAVITVKTADYKGNLATAVCYVTVTEEGDIAGGSYGDLIWFIDKNGRLTVEGTGEFAPVGAKEGDRRAPWHPYAQTDIKSAKIKVTGMTDASYMFYGCDSLKEVDLEEFETGHVTDMTGMFAYCRELADVNVGGFDTGNVTDMAGMFKGCAQLTKLDLSSFDMEQTAGSKQDGGNAGSLADMFEDCSNLAEICTPRNLNDSVTLPVSDGGVWYQPDGTETALLPKGLDYSVLISKNRKPEVFRLILRKARTDYECGEELGLDDLSVTYINGRGVPGELTALSYTVNADEIDMSVPGTKTLIVTHTDTETGKEIRAEIELTVTCPLKTDSLSIRLSGEYPDGTCVYDGTPKTPALEVKIVQTGTVLTEGRDYTAVYGNNINAGTAYVTITGQNDYRGTVTGQFTIRKAAAPETQTFEFTLPGGKIQPEQGFDIDKRYAKYGEITEYRLNDTSDTADGREIFSETPYIDNGILYYGMNAGKEGDRAQITVETVFANYESAVLTLHFKFVDERIIYTVTFDLAGHGMAIPPAAVSGKGGLVEEPPRPEEEGYRFLGWYRDGACTEKWDFHADTVEKNMTLYAGWLVTPVRTGVEFTELQVQEIKNQTYTGSPLKPAIRVYAADPSGTDIVLLKQGKDYTIKYYNNTNADSVGKTGGTCAAGEEGDNGFTKKLPYVVITGKGNYQGTVYRNFHIDPVNISAAGPEGGTEFAKGFTVKYSEQLTVNTTKAQKPFGSVKYKKAMKAGQDYSLKLSGAVFDPEKGIWMPGREIGTTEENAAGQAVTEETAAGKAAAAITAPEIPAGAAGVFILTVTGKGNYCGSVNKVVYVSDKAHLMKNAAVAVGKKQKKAEYTGEDILLNPGYYDVTTKKYYGFTEIGGQTVMDTTNEADRENLFTVKLGGEYLKYGEDYRVSYQNNRSVGTAVLILEGIGRYTGTKKLTFPIRGTAFNEKNIGVEGLEASFYYTGKALTQNGVVLKSMADGTALTYRKDYTISYKNNLKAGTASMTFTANPSSGYTGSFKKTFQIRPAGLSAEGTAKDTVRIIAASSVKAGTPTEEGENGGIEYTDNGIRFTGKVWYAKAGAKISDRIILKNTEGSVLKEGTDYTVSYNNNKAVTKDGVTALPVMKIKGKGNYTGGLEIVFRIDKAPLEGNTNLAAVSFPTAFHQNRADGYEYRPKVKVADGKQTLYRGKDYDIVYHNCTQGEIKSYFGALQGLDRGTVTQAGLDGKKPYAVITAKEGSGYEGSIRIDLTVYQNKLTGSNLYVVVSQEKERITYSGGQVRPEAAVYYGDAKAVKKAKDANVTDENTLVQTYGLKKLKNGSENSQNEGGSITAESHGDYTLTYGTNVTAGTKKGSLTVNGAGLYGGSVTVKFTILKKEVYTIL